MSIPDRRPMTLETRPAPHRCPVHAAVMPCDGEHATARAARILAQHAAGDHTYCATLARCERYGSSADGNPVTPCVRHTVWTPHDRTCKRCGSAIA